MTFAISLAIADGVVGVVVIVVAVAVVVPAEL